MAKGLGGWPSTTPVCPATPNNCFLSQLGPTSLLYPENLFHFITASHSYSMKVLYMSFSEESIPCSIIICLSLMQMNVLCSSYILWHYPVSKYIQPITSLFQCATMMLLYAQYMLPGRHINKYYLHQNSLPIWSLWVLFPDCMCIPSTNEPHHKDCENTVLIENIIIAAIHVIYLLCICRLCSPSSHIL